MKLKLSTERGQALIIFALAAIGLFGVVGLAIDGSAKFSDRRHAQNAADTAALAAALVKVNGLTAGQTDSVCSTNSGWTNSAFCLDIINAAWDRAEENGYDGLIPDSVDVYSPPISGPYTGNSSYIQVIITSHIDTYFARVIGVDQTKNTVEAVAMVGKGGPLFSGASFVSLNPSPNCGSGSVNVGGSGTINLYDGGIFVNSSASCGYSQPNCTALTLNLYGGIVESAGSPISSCDPYLPKDETQEQILIPDEVDIPPEPPECNQLATAYNYPPGSNIWHITPGYYTDFPQSSINGDIVGNKKDIVMDPGVYCVGKRIKWSSTTFDSLDGSSGVTLYIKSGNEFEININSPITFNPSNSGDYEGYLIIQAGNPSNIKNCTINGGSYLNINGTILAPYCNVTINGNNNSNSEITAQIIGWDIKLNGGTTINIHYDPSINAKNKRRIGLMR